MKTKTIRIILIVTLVLLALNLCYTFFGSSRLNKAIRGIENTRDTIGAAIAGVNTAKANIEKLQNEMQHLKKRAERSELQVRIINQQLQLRLEHSRSVVDSLQKEIQKNIKKLDNL